MESEFDAFADDYHKAAPSLPVEYAEFLHTRLGIRQEHRVLELGCGSGALTFPLAAFSARVEGLDMSQRLVAIAKARDTEGTVTWILSPVECFDFGIGRYQVIISFESFHLFPNPDAIVSACISGLVEYGYLAIGWCEFHWESVFRQVIVETFSSFGMPWNEWGYQACPRFGELVRNGRGPCSEVVAETIQVEEQSHIDNIARYLAHIYKAAFLKPNVRDRLIQQLRDRFWKVGNSEIINGATSYWVAYCQKRKR